MHSVSRSFCALLLLSIAILLAPPVAFAFELPPNDGFVTDVTGVLSRSEDEMLEARIADYARTTSNEIAIVIVPTLAGVPIEAASLDLARTWAVGSSKNNGILVLVALEDRLVRIDVGYGLEGAVPDLVAQGIIDTDLLPAFREAQYASGLDAAITSLQRHIGGEYSADRYALQQDASGIGSFVVFFLFIGLQWIMAILSRTKSWWLGGVFGAGCGIALVVLFGWWLSIPLLTVLGLALDYAVSRSYHRRGPTAWWAGGRFGPGGGGSGGGGFGGFGGGSFGGGGASGRW